MLADLLTEDTVVDSSTPNFTPKRTLKLPQSNLNTGVRLAGVLPVITNLQVMTSWRDSNAYIITLLLHGSLAPWTKPRYIVDRIILK